MAAQTNATPLQRALRLILDDAMFRARVRNNALAAQVEVRLPDAEWEQVAAVAGMLDDEAAEIQYGLRTITATMRSA